MMNIRLVRRLTARTLTGVAYASVTMQYFWVLLILLPALIESGILKTLFSSGGHAAPVFELPPIEMSPAVWLFIAVIMAALLIGTLVAIIRTPKAVMSSGDSIIHRATHMAIPVVVHHRKVSKKRKIELTHRITLAVQIMITLLPLIGSLLLPEIEDVTKKAVLIVSALLAAVSVVTFVVAWFVKPIEATSRTR